MSYTPELITVNQDKKETYSAAEYDFAVAGSPTDIFTITGSSSKTVKVLRIGISGNVAVGAGNAKIQLLVRSTANSGGTSTVVTAVPHDSDNASATAVVRSYTANPTTGTLVGNVRANRQFFPVQNSAVESPMIVFEFGFGQGQEIVLRGTSEVLAWNFGGQTVSGGVVACWVEWTEES